MKKHIVLILCIFLAGSFSAVAAQDLGRFIDKRKDAAKDAAAERTGEEADKGIKARVNKELDKIFGAQEEGEEAVEASPDEEYTEEEEETYSSGSSRSSRSSDLQSKAILSAMGITTGTARVKPTYEFNGFIEMTIIEYVDGKPEGEPSIYKTYTNAENYDYGIEISEKGSEDNMSIVFDTENELMLTLTESDGEKNGIAMKITPEQAADIEAEAKENAAEYEETMDQYKQYKTGKSKKILGYNCDEYIIEDEDEMITMWSTKDLNKEMNRGYMKNSTFTGLFMYAYYTDGMVLEYVLEEKDGSSKYMMNVTDIDLNRKNSISTIGYSIMDMSGMMDKMEENAEMEEKD